MPDRMSDSAHTILLVEDNEDDAFLMRRALNRAKVRNPLQIAEDGQQAIDYLGGAGKFKDRSTYPFPKVIFLDLKLPHKSGFDVLIWLHARTDLPPVFIVVLTSSNSPKDILRVQELGVNVYIVKPPQAGLFEELTQRYGIVWQMEKC